MGFKLKKQYRLTGYDYSSTGAYFVTICTQNREEFFGVIRNGIMRLNEIGCIATKFWADIPNHFPFIKLDEWIIMPNHLHGILIIDREYDNDEPVETYRESRDPFGNHGRNMINHIPTIGNKKFSIVNNPMQVKNISLGKIIRWFKGKTDKI